MVWESCIVMLNSDSTGSFYTGDIVTGSVVLEFNHEQKIDHIDFKVLGKSKAQWNRSMPTMPYIKIYSAKSKVLDYSLDVFSEISGKTIQPSIQTFHFHFVLPEDLPSSFESSIAKVHYFIKISGKAAYKFIQHKVVPFTVQGNVNINHIEDYLIPSFNESSKVFWNSGKIIMRFKTFKGFSPKQYAPFEVILTNENKVKLSKIYVTLIQKLQYNVTAGYANEEKKVHKVEHHKFSNTITETCNFGMEIPHTTPSSVHITNAMIDISYIFRVEVVFNFHTSHYADIPVTIATTPVMHYDFEHSEFVK